MHGVTRSQCIQLTVCVGKRLTKHLHEFLQKMPVRLHDLENLVERHRDDLGALQRYRAVLTLLSRSTKLSHNVSSFADIVDELMAILGNASDFHIPRLEEEKHPFVFPHVVNYLIFFEGRHATILQDDIAKLPSKGPCQCRAERPVMCC